MAKSSKFTGNLPVNYLPVNLQVKNAKMTKWSKNTLGKELGVKRGGRGEVWGAKGTEAREARQKVRGCARACGKAGGGSRWAGKARKGNFYLPFRQCQIIFVFLT